MNIHQGKNREEALQAAIVALQGYFKNAQGKPILFLSSGGSAFQLLPGLKQEHVGRHLTITVLDERYSKNPKVSNFSQLASLPFYHYASKVIDTRVRGEESLDELAWRFEKELRSWKQQTGGTIIATEGVGADGHTAGIFPVLEDPDLFQELFDNKERWVVGYRAPVQEAQHPLRVTTTLVFLRSVVDAVVVYAVGPEKSNALKRVLAETGSLHETPARIMREMKEVTLCTDYEIY